MIIALMCLLAGIFAVQVTDRKETADAQLGYGVAVFILVLLGVMLRLMGVE